MAKKTVRTKHIAQRTCVVCRLKIDKRRLTRIVRTEEGIVLVDPTGKLNGRGAYLCEKSECWHTVMKSKVLDKALKTEVREEDKLALASRLPDSKSQDISVS